jgi:hypothetical protein
VDGRVQRIVSDALEHGLARSNDTRSFVGSAYGADGITRAHPSPAEYQRPFGHATILGSTLA